MKKGRILGLVVVMTLICTACGPDNPRVRDYAAQAQRMGEYYFGESIAPVSLLMENISGKTEARAASGASAEQQAAEEAETETQAAAEQAAAVRTAGPRIAETETQTEAAETETKTGTAAAEPETQTGTAAAGPETEETAAAETETEETAALELSESETEETAAETEASEPETEETAAETEASEPETEETAAETEPSEQESGEQPETEAAEEPAAADALTVLARKLSDRALAVMEEKAESLEGKLAGRDALDAEELGALDAVWSRGSYGSRTECLVLSGAVSGEDAKTGCFLFLFDGSRLNAAGIAKGDLWYVCGSRVQDVLRDVQLDEMRLLEGGEGFSLLLKGKREGGSCVRVVTGTERGALSRFADALNVEETQDGLAVFYAPEHFRYDPMTEEWTPGEGEVPYYYERNGDGFAPLPVLELSLEEYLACLSAETDDPEAEDWAKEQEKLFSGAEDGLVYRFFGIGEDRIGYRVRRIAEDSQGNPCAEYRYAIYELQDGALTEACPVTEGEGFYWFDLQKKEAELASLNEVPERYAANRTDQIHTALKAGERQALEAVLEEQEYPANALCFVSLADFDGDREMESFVAVGTYDGAFGAPVCDLWYAGQDGLRLLEEQSPMKNAGICRIGRNALYLWTGWETDFLYGVEEEQPCRYLADARRIEVGAEGDIDAWFADGAGSCPWPYFYKDGQVEAYRLYEAEPEALLDYENGEAVLTALRYRAPDGFSCLAGDNGLWYVTVPGADGSSRYEIYHVRNGELVLIGCGDGGYGAAGETSGTQGGE